MIRIYLQFLKIFRSEFEIFVNYENRFTKFEKLIINNLTFALYSAC